MRSQKQARSLTGRVQSLYNCPRKTLGYLNPSEKLAQLLATTP